MDGLFSPFLLSLAAKAVVAPPSAVGTPSMSPAIITAKEKIKGPLPHVSALQYFSGEEGEVLTTTTI